MSDKYFTCNLGTCEISCAHPGCICIQLGSSPNETDCRCIGDIYKTTPDSYREVSEIDEFIDKTKQNVDTAIFTINMADFLEMFVSEESTRISTRKKVPETSQ